MSGPLSPAAVAEILADGAMGRAGLARYIDTNLHLGDPRCRGVTRVVVRREVTHRALAAENPAHVHAWPHPLGRVTALAAGGREIHIAAPEGDRRVAACAAQHQLWRALGLAGPAPTLAVTGSPDDARRHADAWAVRVADAAGGRPVVLCLHGQLNLRHALVPRAARDRVRARCAELAGDAGDAGGVPGAASGAERDRGYWVAGQAAVDRALAGGAGARRRLAEVYRDALCGLDGAAGEADAAGPPGAADWLDAGDRGDPLLDFSVIPRGSDAVVATSFTAGEQAALLAEALHRRAAVREVIASGSCGGLAREPGARPAGPVVVPATAAREIGAGLDAGAGEIALAPWPEVDAPPWLAGATVVPGPVATVLTPAVETRGGLAAASTAGVVAVECELAPLAAAARRCQLPLRAVFGVVDWPLAGTTPAAPSGDMAPLWACAEWIAVYLDRPAR